ncbi:MAG: sulfatase-like hydrolase/transferase [Planctomycetes bacterium]|nr:sulfatase-like hydrolase/transferase [Planctomycetota bacterium]
MMGSVLKGVRRLLAVCLVTMAGIPGTAGYGADSKPNVVLIVIDDLGWADLGCYGSKFHKTPQLDKLATEGMRFTQAYAACPVCSPTRAAIMTGRYPQRMNITTWLPGHPDRPAYRLKQPEVSQQLPASETTIAEALKPAGYVSGSIGKWHLGGAGSSPLEHGFDFNIGGDQSGSPYSYFAPYKNGNKSAPGLEQAPDGEYLTDRLGIEAEKFIDAHYEQPFFLYLPHYAVHTPLKAKPETIAKYGAMPQHPNGSQINPIYAAMMESMDDAVGRVLKKLEERKLSERTLVIFTSDNGGLANGNGQMIPPTSNAPLRDGKSHLYEGGIRVPLIVKWPGVVKPGSTSDAVVSSIDFFPTILAACGVTAEAKEAIDGVNLRPVLDGTGKLDRSAIYWHFPHYNGNAGAKPGAAIRAGDWKLIEFYETGRRELFNVAINPGESNNLIEQNADIANNLFARLNFWRESVGARFPAPNPDYTPNPPGKDGTITMHSSTADVNGIMLRYEPLPNKDTLGYWVRQEDWASFEFTVIRPGKYHLIPHVGCGTNGGSLVQFEVAGQSFPLTVPATGGFQKFVPQDLGVVTFDKPGRYTLTIKPQKKEGVAVMDVRVVVLKPAELALREMLPELHLLEPFWRSAVVHRESVLCVQDATDRPATGKLLFPATKILAVHSANGRTQYQLGMDYNLSTDGTQLELTDKSRIPKLHAADLFPPKGKLPQWAGGSAAGPESLPHKIGDPETYILFNNGHWFHDQQIEVTYERSPINWPGPVPLFDASRLPRTMARLKAKQKLTIGVSGDSITYGLNASGLVGAPPFMPMYPDLVAAQLQATTGSEIALFNRAIGGWGVPNGLADLDKLLDHEPDLVLIAYGMNDVGRRNPDAYRDGIQQMITRIQEARPQAEIILVATMLGNDQWQHTPREMFPKYRDALTSLCGEGVALVDLTALWTEMLKRKRDCDLTGNGVNHPSDFGHRVYASAILSLLIEPK